MSKSKTAETEPESKPETETESESKTEAETETESESKPETETKAETGQKPDPPARKVPEKVTLPKNPKPSTTKANADDTEKRASAGDAKRGETGPNSLPNRATKKPRGLLRRLLLG